MQNPCIVANERSSRDKKMPMPVLHDAREGAADSIIVRQAASPELLWK